MNSNKYLSYFFVIVFTFTSFSFLWAEANIPPSITVGHFSEGPKQNGLPDQWTTLNFKKVKPTHYELIQDDGTWVIKAKSQSSASGFITRTAIDPKEYPILKWRWKVQNLLKKSNLTKKSGDDHPARVYIGFEYDRSQFSLAERILYLLVHLFYGRDYPSRSINYIWASNDPVGTVRPNPYTKWVQMVVTESGGANLDRWVEIKRNVYEDYKNIFGKEPPLISGIGIMTDSDSTGDEAVAYYGDLVFSRNNQTEDSG